MHIDDLTSQKLHLRTCLVKFNVYNWLNVVVANPLKKKIRNSRQYNKIIFSLKNKKKLYLNSTTRRNLGGPIGLLCGHSVCIVFVACMSFRWIANMYYFIGSLWCICLVSIIFFLDLISFLIFLLSFSFSLVITFSQTVFPSLWFDIFPCFCVILI